MAEAAAAERCRTFYGWAAVDAGLVRRNGRDVVATPIPKRNPYHGDIVLPDSATMDREEQTRHAQELAAASQSVAAASTSCRLTPTGDHCRKSGVAGRPAVTGSRRHVIANQPFDYCPAYTLHYTSPAATPLQGRARFTAMFRSGDHSWGQRKTGNDALQNWRFATRAGLPPSPLRGRVAPLEMLLFRKDTSARESAARPAAGRPTTYCPRSRGDAGERSCDRGTRHPQPSPEPLRTAG